MTKDPTVLFEHILESINLIEEYAADISEDVFLSDVGLQDKIIRRLSVIGEAMSHIPKEIQEQHPEVRWRDIIGMRNFLIHEYFGISVAEVWGTVKKDVPLLREQILVIWEREKKRKPDSL